MKKLAIFFLLCLFRGQAFPQFQSENPDQHRFGPLTHAESLKGQGNNNLDKSFYKQKSDWQKIIDQTWGSGNYQDKLAVFDAYTDAITSRFAGFDPIGITLEEWNSMKHAYRSQITLSTTIGAFSGLMSRLTYELGDYHTFAGDTIVFNTPLNPGIPILVIGAWDVRHFGATLTVLPDNSLLVIRAFKNHPLDLHSGDKVLGYEGKPWKDLVDELLSSGIPIAHFQRNAESARRHVELTSAGMNWHLFDTIDIVKYGIGDTVHLSVSPLINLNVPLWWNLEQFSVPGVPLPDPSDISEPVYSGKVEGTNIGYISVYGEISRTNTQFYNAVNSLKGTEGLIIDLRNNNGGWPLPRSGLDLLFNSFLYTLEDVQRCNWTDLRLCSTNDRHYWHVEGNPQSWYNKPIAVLTGPNCVSCGEYLAYALSYHPTVRFFGMTTCGAPGWTNEESISTLGWICSYTPKIATRIDQPGILLSHKEFPVQESVWFDVESIVNGKDPVAQKAINWIQNVTNVYDIFSEPMIRMYPNPSGDIINIEISNPREDDIEIELFTVSGQLIYKKEYKSNHNPFVRQIDLSGYAKGIYLLRICQSDKVTSRKIIVQ